MNSQLHHDPNSSSGDDDQLRLEAGSFDPARLSWSIGRHWPVLLVFPLVVASAGYFYSASQPDVYEAEAAVIVQPTYAQAELDVDVRQASDAERDVANEAAILEGARIAQLVDDELGGDVSYRADVREGTDIIVITAQAPDPIEVAAIADGVAGIYLRERSAQQSVELEDAIVDLETGIAELEAQLDTLAGLLAATPDDPALLAQQDAVLGELTTTRSDIESLRRQGTTSEPGARLMAGAEVPDSPVAPSPTRTAILLGLTALLIGLAIAWYRTRDLAPDEAQSPPGGQTDLVPSAAIEPVSTRLWSESGSPAFNVQLDVSDHERAALYERIALDVIGRPQAILIAGAVCDAGVAEVASGIARAISHRSVRTLLIAATRNDPAIDATFGLGGQPGLSDLAAGLPLRQGVHLLDGDHHLGVLPRGSRPGAMPSMASEQMAGTIDMVTGLAPMTIVVGPAIVSGADARALVRQLQATVLVAPAGCDTRRLEAARRAIRDGGGTVMGVISVTGASRPTPEVTPELTTGAES